MKPQITFEDWQDVGYNKKSLQFRIPVFRLLSSIFLHARILELFYCTIVWRKKAETSQDRAHEEKLLFKENLVIIMSSKSTAKNLSVYKHYMYDLSGFRPVDWRRSIPSPRCS